MSRTAKDLKANPPNPTGKGGFGDHPENQSGGRWSGDTSISHQYNKLIRLSVAEFLDWVKQTPEKDRTVAQELAYNSVVKARKDLAYLKEVTDRTEGKSLQRTDLTSAGDKINPIPILGGASVSDDDGNGKDTRAKKAD